MKKSTIIFLVVIFIVASGYFFSKRIVLGPPTQAQALIEIEKEIAAAGANPADFPMERKQKAAEAWASSGKIYHAHTGLRISGIVLVLICIVGLLRPRPAAYYALFGLCAVLIINGILLAVAYIHGWQMGRILFDVKPSPDLEFFIMILLAGFQTIVGFFFAGCFLSPSIKAFFNRTVSV